MKLVTVAQMRQIEAEADASGLSYAEMMARAGAMTAVRVRQRLNDIPDAKITVLVGKGNNGGDGLVAARHLAEHFDVRCYLLARFKADFAPFKAAQEANLFMAFAEDDDGRVLRHMIASADLLLDAVFGIGVHLPLTGDAAQLLRRAKQAIRERHAYLPDTALFTPTDPFSASPSTRLQVVAVDCPSGLDCDTGEHDPNTIRADETITYIAPKVGHVTFPGAEMVGTLTIAPLGLDESLPAFNSSDLLYITERDAQERLPLRTLNSNKGTFGKTMIAAGSINFTGAPALCAEAAYRSGAGLVTVACPAPVITSIAAKLTEPTWVLLPHDQGVIAERAVETLQQQLHDYHSLLIGPGLTQESSAGKFLDTLLSGSLTQKRQIGFRAEQTGQSDHSQALPPMVLDADALNLLAKHEQGWKQLPPNTIITPHPGEMARLSQRSIAEIQADRLNIAREKATQWGVVLVLKGAHTIIAAPDKPTAIMPFKSDALATAGTGDVLAGLIAGLLAQSLEPYDAAILGAFVHGLAGEIAARKHGNTRSVIAGDVVHAIRAAFAALS